MAWGLLCTTFTLRAQEPDISVSPTPVGSGARAAGMANAFVAIADDATAASWNPAGLVQLERPEISAVGSYNFLFESFAARGHDESERDHYSDKLDLNYLSLVYPLPFLVLGKNATVSLNFQKKYELNHVFDLNFNTFMHDGVSLLSNFLVLDYEQKGSLNALSPAVALELTQRLSVGATFNFWRDSFLGESGWTQRTRSRMFILDGVHPVIAFSNTQEEYKNFTGSNLTLGVLWTPTDRWSFGLRYDTAFTGNADYRKHQLSMQLDPRPLVTNLGPFFVREQRKIRFPATLAVGAAWRANDRLTVALDVTRTDWNDFYIKDAYGARRSLVDSGNIDDLFAPHFKPTSTARCGVEYVLLPKQPDEVIKRLWTLRGGLLYDEEPATGKSAGFVLGPNKGSGEPESFYGLALGAGLQLNQRVNIDVAYQVRYGQEINRDMIRGVPAFKEDYFQHRLLFSTIIYF
ncbi:MAG: outer membrane protein transport protein [Candidatus Hydrogenedentes bacterium]|nr:outer membrane protein transport protein [Candidatus Hydrogenedentota bacterium]